MSEHVDTQAAAREAGITYAACRDILNDYAASEISFGRLVERLRELAQEAAARLASEERAAVVAWLERQGGRGAWTLVDAIRQGEHRKGEP